MSDNAWFTYKNNELHVENVRVADIIRTTSTPAYCYSLRALTENLNAYTSIPNSLICFAVKANSNLTVLNAIARLGGGADVVSEGEIRIALKAGIPPSKIVFSGVGKTATEIEFALNQNIHQINFESVEELMLINEIAEKIGKCAVVVPRLSPGIDAKTNYKITTGLYHNKFGIPFEQIKEIDFEVLKNVKVVGVSAHVGSQICSLDIFKRLLDYLKETADSFERILGYRLSRVDIGGGLGISYSGEDKPPSIQEYAELVRTSFENSGLEIICEPGRSIVGIIGILVTKVLFNKNNSLTSHVIIDAGMNDFARPAIYGSVHRIIPVHRNDSLEKQKVDIVGPVCETSDTFVRDCTLQKLNSGDLLCICDVGAYGSSMGNNYNARLTSAEVLVNDDEFALIRNRGNYETLLCGTLLQEEIFR